MIVSDEMTVAPQVVPPMESEVLQAISSDIADLIVKTVFALVDSPEDVSITIIPDGRETTFRLKAADSDVGKVIGKQGRTARALRTILSAASMKAKHRFTLDIVNPAANRAA